MDYINLGKNIALMLMIISIVALWLESRSFKRSISIVNQVNTELTEKLQKAKIDLANQTTKIQAAAVCHKNNLDAKDEDLDEICNNIAVSINNFFKALQIFAEAVSLVRGGSLADKKASFVLQAVERQETPSDGVHLGVYTGAYKNFIWTWTIEQFALEIGILDGDAVRIDLLAPMSVNTLYKLQQIIIGNPTTLSLHRRVPQGLVCATGLHSRYTVACTPNSRILSRQYRRLFYTYKYATGFIFLNYSKLKTNGQNGEFGH